MPNEVLYKTNADYDLTVENLKKHHPLIVKDGYEVIDYKTGSPKGLFCFEIRNTKFLLSRGGRLQVVWKSLEEKRACLRLLKGLLKTGNGEPLEITPIKQTFWLEYPPPKDFRLYWCDTACKYEEQVLPREAEAEMNLVFNLLCWEEREEMEREGGGCLYGIPFILRYEKPDIIKKILNKIW
jgi:hypothetical protein